MAIPVLKKSVGASFLLEGSNTGEAVLYINIEESEKNVRQNAASFGFGGDGIEFLDLSPDSDFFSRELL